MMTRAQMFWLAALVVGDSIAGAICWGYLPPRSPVHWNIHGQVDGYGPSWLVAILIPIVLVALAGLLWGLTQIPPIGTALARSGPIYGRMVIASLGAGVGLHAIMLLVALGKPIDPSLGFAIIPGVMMAVLGNWMGKLRRNQVAGIRTPWTLKSDVVWERTHRVGGRLMVALGLAILLAAVLFPLWAVVAVVAAGVPALVAWAFVYSWWLDRLIRAGKPVA